MLQYMTCLGACKKSDTISKNETIANFVFMLILHVHVHLQNLHIKENVKGSGLQSNDQLNFFKQLCDFFSGHGLNRPYIVVI
jgi:hypothetical protein